MNGKNTRTSVTKKGGGQWALLHSTDSTYESVVTLVHWIIYLVLCNIEFEIWFEAWLYYTGRGLNDSPVGLAAYILEKFSTWTDPEFKKLEDGGLER